MLWGTLKYCKVDRCIGKLVLLKYDLKAQKISIKRESWAPNLLMILSLLEKAINWAILFCEEISHRRRMQSASILLNIKVCTLVECYSWPRVIMWGDDAVGICLKVKIISIFFQAINLKVSVRKLLRILRWQRFFYGIVFHRHFRPLPPNNPPH